MSDDIQACLPDLPPDIRAMLTGRPERLGGLTNRVYRIGQVILRIPGAGTADYIDRKAEAVAAAAAARAGVGPDVLHADPDSGLMVTQLVPDAVTLSPQAFRARPGAIGRAARALARLHGSGQVFATRFELFAMIDGYLALLGGTDVTLPRDYHRVVDEAAAIRAVLARHDLPVAPCHCDPLCENFLDAGGRVWIVDWEYSGMNDPMWDLGDLSVEAGFDDAQDRALLEAYFDRAIDPRDHARMVVYKAMCDLLWTLWGLIQLANGNPADDFRAYAEGRFARCRTLMGSAGFAGHLAVLEGRG